MNSLGNKFNLRTEVAGKTTKNYNDMVVAIRDGHCTSVVEALQLWPISVFIYHGDIKNLLLKTRVKARRLEEIIGNQQIPNTHRQLAS